MESQAIEVAVGRSGATVKVKSWDQLLQLMQKERAKWAWLVRGDGATDQHGWATNVQNQWDQLINNVSGNQAAQSPLAKAQAVLAPLSSSLAASFEEDGALILEIREAVGDVAAAYAYAFLKRSLSLNDVRTKDQLTGVVLTAFPDVRDAASIAERLQRERQNYRNSLRTAVQKHAEETEENTRHFDELITRVRQVSASMLRLRRNRWKGVQNEFQRQGLDAIQSIRAVEAAFMEAMHLQAPVKYWTTKAADHAKERSKGSIRLGVYFIATAVVLGLAFYAAAQFVLKHSPSPGEQTPIALYVVVSGGLAVLFTIAFWVGQLLTRLYLSEHHLKTDAEERAVMTKTYLALTKEGQATDAERQLVLAQLFRGSSDGIVRDDGPPEIAIQSLLSKLIARQH
jgi:hypothetical protein